MERLSKSINMLNDVAMGRRKADLVLDGCSLVSVYTGEIVPDTQVAVVNGRIAYVGSDAAHTIGSKTTIIHLGGKYLVPGFADPHTHIDQFVMPQDLAEKSLLHGTTTLFADCNRDITSVCTTANISYNSRICKLCRGFSANVSSHAALQSDFSAILVNVRVRICKSGNKVFST